MKKLLLPLILLFTGCEKEEVNISSTSTYPELIGKYERIESDIWGDDDEYQYYSHDYFIFNNTNVAEYRILQWFYSEEGWYNEEKEYREWNVDWKVESNKIHFDGINDNGEAETDIMTFEYKGNSILLNGNEYIKKD